ncbi:MULTISPECIES: hypothetical protein [unclassified Mesorhizobium]|uniref:DUF7716 domain-containing protein n=1 Tax=unclassified Mesorhizobium TaxID=325217 RepID=UPI000FDBAD7E|nr:MULTISPECIES: hypothetical protein [unclassified Mesorhizobium]TGR17814.1 hypothetical protein EN845_29055 [Mesorhizobium sp. M8A.F.Ca.ET.202.01.1.1]TGR19814.1 hypothetical protein EN840_28885 [Mesorhizobium sp. M8A.F.Ca.ET.197.01.1.1]TGR37730.1 hypothetical protein EN842_48925 [bacterium M00.F.Ca.ET.199.01.1.1]TGR43023.1 hypothetical protein EN841_28880 [Mesorhizobium sp. M8A.F.Ca.ET.198.01.1.1]
MKLLDIVGRLSEFDEEDPVYAAEPWTEDSDAMVLPQQDGVLVPREAAKEGLAYFLEINLAIEITEALVVSQKEKPNISAICERVIYYATYDA